MVKSNSTSPQTAAEQIQFMKQLGESTPRYSAEERINHYIERAEAALEAAQDKKRRLDLMIKDASEGALKALAKKQAKNNERRVDLRLMITYGNLALQALDKRDFNRLINDFDLLTQYREKSNIPYFEKVAQSNRAKGKTGQYGPVRKIVECLYLNSLDNTDIFERWRKTRKIIETGNGEKWSLFAYRIDETIDALRNVKPEDYEYFYADRSGEDPEDDDVQLVEIPVTVGSIKTALSRIRKDI